MTQKLFFVMIMVLAILGFQASALADYATTPQPYPQPHHPYPQPHYPNNPAYPHYGSYPYPYPAYPAPAYPYPMPANYVMCFAQGLANGAFFYGVGLNVYAANQWALYACGSTGQYCQLTGCRY